MDVSCTGTTRRWDVVVFEKSEKNTLRFKYFSFILYTIFLLWKMMISTEQSTCYNAWNFRRNTSFSNDTDCIVSLLLLIYTRLYRDKCVREGGRHHRSLEQQRYRYRCIIYDIFCQSCALVYTEHSVIKNCRVEISETKPFARRPIVFFSIQYPTCQLLLLLLNPNVSIGNMLYATIYTAWLALDIMWLLFLCFVLTYLFIFFI